MGVIASAQAAVDCLAVGPEDEVLVLCNDPQLMIADALGEAAGGARASRSGAGVPGRRAARGGAASRGGRGDGGRDRDLRSHDVLVVAYRRARGGHAARHRMATMPGINDDVFRRALDVDYGELKRAGEALAAQLTAANFCRVRSRGGTDLTCWI